MKKNKILTVLEYLTIAILVILSPLIIVYIGYYIQYSIDCFLNVHIYTPRIPFLNSISGKIKFDRVCILVGIVLLILVIIMDGGSDSASDDDLID